MTDIELSSNEKLLSYIIRHVKNTDPSSIVVIIVTISIKWKTSNLTFEALDKKKKKKKKSSARRQQIPKHHFK